MADTSRIPITASIHHRPVEVDQSDAGVRSVGLAEPEAPREVDRVVDGGVAPAGVALAGRWPAPVQDLSDAELGRRFLHLCEAEGPVADQLLEQLESEMHVRLLGTVGPPGASPGRPANTLVTPQVGLAILDNVARGQPPFQPKLGKGQASWFVTEGQPYVGPLRGKGVPVRVAIVPPDASVVYREAELAAILEHQRGATAEEAKAEFRRRFAIPEDAPMQGKAAKSLRHFARKFAESRMWDEVGRRAARAPNGVLEVVLEPGSDFSKQGPGRFVVVSDPNAIKLKEGVLGVVQAVEAAGVETSADLRAAAEAFAAKMKWAGRVRAAFHYGGRVLLVVAIAADTYKIATAENKRKATLTSVGGWAGAAAASSAFGSSFAPADTAGPWA